MVYRLYVEKKPSFDGESRALLLDLQSNLQIEALEGLRILNRYDVEQIDKDLFDACRNTVFSEPQTDVTYDALPKHSGPVFAVEPLPGQFDQRADSCAQCIQLVSQKERPLVRAAKVYFLSGALTEGQLEQIKKYIINPVDSREASLDPSETLKMQVTVPTEVATVAGFTEATDEQLSHMLSQFGFAMDLDDLRLCRSYFQDEGREPTITELKMLDTYWSDHCRHTTFMTVLEEVTFEEGGPAAEAFARYQSLRAELGVTKPICLMDLGTIAAKYLKNKGVLNDLDESEEINACTVKVKADVNGKMEDWLLLFKNETHNHPTEIEPFGGAATCIGGAIRDPLSGRGYVYQAMRVTGAANPLQPVSETIPGKLPQRKITTEAAAGYSSYGNQVGLATGLVDELYHPGYAAKRMEIGAVLGAVPAAHVRRETPEPGDVVILLGGRTGRDGCGGATGSSKSHVQASLETSGAEVQKGNAPEERKIQRLFRDGEAVGMIKRCNDFGAGGVSVAIGELADGLRIDLNKVPKKYEGLDGTELAISESQERMAVVVEAKDAPRFVAFAHGENLEATVVAEVTEEKRLVLEWNGEEIANISRAFLNSAGARKTARAKVKTPMRLPERKREGSIQEQFASLLSSLNVCSKRGLAERFDATIGAGTVLMPFGGSRQRTPIQAMVCKLPVPGGKTETCSVMAYGCNPELLEQSPYHGAYLAVVESVSKVIAAGGHLGQCWLSFQEYFERLREDPVRWGKPTAALLGALDAQLDLGVAAVGGKDSMSGSFEQMDVPPTLCSFAVSLCNVGAVMSPEFKSPGHKVVLVTPQTRTKTGLPGSESLKETFGLIGQLIAEQKVAAVYTPAYGGIAEGIFKMCVGNHIGFAFAPDFDMDRAFGHQYGAFILELKEDLPIGEVLGHTTEKESISFSGGCLSLSDLERIYEEKLEPVFPSLVVPQWKEAPLLSYPATQRPTPRTGCIRPRVLIPVFPGTNCEYDTAAALQKAGAAADVMIIQNGTAADVAASVVTFEKKIKQSQMIFIPGGFSGGDEPDGAGKFITAFFRNPKIKDAVTALLQDRDGLMCGICNGFQALVKLGLVPYGEIRDMDETCPTLTFNEIGRHQSRLVLTRVASNKSPWLTHSRVGDVYQVPVSHGEGRFVCPEGLLEQLKANGQIATQYVDETGAPSMDIGANPNGSVWAVEGITSPDGRVFGRMAHTERFGNGLYQNVPFSMDALFFRGAVDYFRI
ncbi:MAG: phosphoribosylformylglycinamidine synthase [Oscillospiraceae bacterium]|jgi:phosphoribosylformylglycinamidine synthase